MKCFVILLSLVFLAPLHGADEEPSPAANLINLLKRLPKERQGNVVGRICERGNAADLAYILERCVAKDGFLPAVRVTALDALADAAATRKIVPKGDLSILKPLLKLDAPTRLAALRLAVLWKVPALRSDIEEVALAANTEDSTRQAALSALVTLGGKESRTAIEKLATADQPQKVRYLAVAALVPIDVSAAATRAAEVLAKGAATDEPAPMIAAFLDLKGGADKLAEAVAKQKLSVDTAKLCIRFIYGVGRSDPPLIAAFSKSSGFDISKKPFEDKEIPELAKEVLAKGNASRGEAIFRRGDLNCMKCHSINGAGGPVGPDLKEIGTASPADYLLKSILNPDEAIKEEYLTVKVTTSDGKQYQGIVVEDSEARLVLRDATGLKRTIPKADVEDRQKGGSLMPAGLANFLTRAELIDLGRFLSELGKPGEYAITLAPVVRRWRVLTAAPEAILKDVPDEDTFRKLVLEADPSRWQGVYSRVAGYLPLSELPGSKVYYVQGEIDVKTAGRVGIKFDSPVGVSAWIDDKAVAFTDRIETELEAGVRKITFRIDASKRPSGQFRVELVKLEGSEAEVQIVGGQ